MLELRIYRIIKFHGIVFLFAKFKNEIPDYLLHNFDILFARTGGTVGKSFADENTTRTLNLQDI